MSTDQDQQINLKIVKRIRELRENKSWTQQKLAERAGLNSNFVAKVERGESKPSGVTIIKLAKALGVKSTEILGI